MHAKTTTTFVRCVTRILVVLGLVCTAAVAPAAYSQAQATSIQLPNGNTCQSTGTGPAPTFNGQRVTYTCGSAPNNGTNIILGTPSFQNGFWTITTGVMTESGSDLTSSSTLSVDFTRVTLADGTNCTWVGSSPATVEGQALNYTCGQPDVALLGDFNTSNPLWTTVRVRLAGQPGSFSVTSRDTIGVQNLVSQTHGGTPTPTPAPNAQATTIQLPDGSICQFAGTGSTAVFNGQRVNYNCGSAPNNGTKVILGTPTVQNNVWTVMTGVTVQGNNGPELQSPQTITMTLSNVTLVDDSSCTPVAAGTVVTVDNRPMNYTCGRAEEGLLGDFDLTNPLWTANKVVIDTSQTPPRIAQTQTRGIRSVVGVTATAPTAQATSIQLPDGSTCQFAGTGPTVTVNGQPVNYNCGTAPDGSISVILGTPTFQNATLTVQHAVITMGASGPTLRSSDTQTLDITSVALVDGTACQSTGQGATIAVDGQRLNYTCGSQNIGLVGDFSMANPLWTAQRVQFTGAPANTVVTGRDTVGVQTAATQTHGGAGPTPSPTPAPSPQAPPQTRDERYFRETNFRVANDAFWNFFQSLGAVETFGFPVSRQFGFLGCQVQMFQRSIMQQCGDNAAVALMNMLDPEIFPYTRVNGSVFPAPDDTIKANTPVPGSPGYDQAIIQFVQNTAPNTFEGQPVNYFDTFNNTGGLEIWGAPISNPAYDPSNRNFIYQRFQRGIMHYTTGQGTRGILLADYLKAIMLGPQMAQQKGSNLPPDLDAEAKGSNKYSQYCPANNLWLCRPNDLSGTNLTYAFEAG